MTTIRIYWRRKGDGLVDYVLQMDPAKESFMQGQQQGPDAFLLPHGNSAEGKSSGLDIVLCNGLVDDVNPSLQRGRLEGTVWVEAVWPQKVDEVSETTQELYPPTDVSIDDGRGCLLQIGKPAATGPLPTLYREEILRGCDDLTDSPQEQAIKTKLQAANFVFDDSKYANPDNAKEDRIIQSVWAGALAYALYIRCDEALAGARDFVKQQIELRPCLYYDKAGTPIGEVRDDIWIDEHGFRKGYHGKWNRDAFFTGVFIEVAGAQTPIKAIGQLEDPEHLAPKRQFLLAAAGDGVGRFYSRFYVQAMLTRPGIKTVKTAQQARAAGYTLEMLVEANLAGVLNDMAASIAVHHVLDGLNLSRGVGIGGTPFMACWPVETVHTTHVGITEDVSRKFFEARGIDWPWGAEWKFDPNQVVKWLQAVEDDGALGYSNTELTTGPDGLQTLVNGVTIWGMTIIGRGLAKVARRWPDLDLMGLPRDAARFIIERGCGVGIDGDGNQIQADWTFDSAAPRCWRVRQANAPKDGTTRWCVAGFLDLAELLQGPATMIEDELVKMLRAAAKRTFTDAPDLHLGAKGIVCIETAGLLAQAAFG